MTDNYMQSVRMAGAANANVQNQINVSLIFNYMRQHGETYRAEISRNVGLSAPAVSRVIEVLIEQGYITESGTLLTSNGKNVSRIIVNPDKGCVIAVDYMKGRSIFGCFDITGQLIHQTRGDYFVESADVVLDLIDQIKRFIGEVNLSVNGKRFPEIKALCLGIPCAVDTTTGKTTGAWLFDFLIDLNLKSELEKEFDIPVFIESELKLAALAENRLGEGKHHRNLVYIDINSEGIGAGIILDNHIVRGAHGLAGEIGYSIVPGAGIERKKSDKGYLESHASLNSQVQSVITRLEKGETSILVKPAGTHLNDYEDITPRIVYQAALDGDSLCRSVIAESVDLLTTITINLILVVNPEIVVIGGEIFDLPGVDELLLKPLQRRMAEVLPVQPPELGFSKLGADACVRGAALFGVESILLGKYPFAVDYVRPLKVG